jgi:hypothetical protein
MASKPHLRAVVEGEPQRIWRLIDLDTGESQDFDSCPECQQSKDALETLQGKMTAMAAEITRLKRDPETVAREHKLWNEAECAHTWWRLACWHPATRFEADEFFAAKPRLIEKDCGLVGLLKSICGMAYEPYSRVLRNGHTMVYDDFQRACNKQKAHYFAQAVPGGPDSEAWKRWLIERIESNLA